MLQQFIAGCDTELSVTLAKVQSLRQGDEWSVDRPPVECYNGRQSPKGGVQAFVGEQEDKISSDLDKAVESFRQASKQREPIYPPRVSCVRRTGLWVGAAVGLAYGLSHLVLLINSPDLFYPPSALELVGICLSSILAGIGLGLACAWPKTTLNGVAAASLVLTILASLFYREFLSLFENPVCGLMAVFMIGVALLLSMPVAALLRWTIASQCELPRRPSLIWRRILLLLAVLFLAAFLGGGLPL
jgi:hypothetical protein